jgi:hypothetical protein
MEGRATPRKRRNDRLFLANWSAIRAFVIGRMQPRTLAQHLLEIGRATMLLEQIAERLVSQFLKRFHTVEREPVQGLPGFAIEGDAFADLA